MDRSDALDAESLLRHGAWLAQLARALVASDDEIDDVVQQTYAQALAAPPRHARNLRAWLGAIARNVVRAGRRSDVARSAREALAEPPAPAETPAELVARAELRRAVVDAVLALAEPYRSTILLRFFEEREVAAIARITKAPEPTVRTRLRRGIELVKVALQARAGRGTDDATTAQALLFARLCDFAKSAGGGTAGSGIGAAAAAALAAGGVAMSLATKWTLAGAAAVVAALAFTTWMVRGRDGRPLAANSSVTRATAAGAVAREELQPAARAAEPLPSASASPPAPDEIVAADAFKSDCTVTGVVRYPRGEPAAGVDVMALIAPRYTPPSIGDIAAIVKTAHAAKSVAEESANHRPQAMTTTDSAGRFTLAGLSDEENWMVGAVDADGASAVSDQFKFQKNRRLELRELTLAPIATVSGRVVAPDGTPIGGACVMVYLHQGDGSGTVSFTTPLTGPDAGRWSSGRQLAESFDVSAEAPGFMRNWPGQHVDVSTGRHDAEVEIVLEPADGLLVSGPIVDESGAPVDLFARMKSLPGTAGAVSATGVEDEELARLAVFDVADGPPPDVGQLLEGGRDAGRILFEQDRYEFRLPAAWRGWFVLTLKGRVVGSARVDDPAQAPPLPFLVPPPEARMKTALVVVSVVDGATGAALDARNLGVSVESTRTSTLQFPRRAPASVAVPEGAVAFVAPLERVRVSVRRPGYLSTCPEIVLTQADERRDMTVRLSPANCGIRGRALNHDGSPNPGVEINVYHATEQGFEGVCVEPPETNEDGTFNVRGLAAGEYVVVGGGGHDAPATARTTAAEKPPTVELRSPEGVHAGFRILAPPAPDGRSDLTFRIVDASGLPVVNHLGAFVQTSWQATTFGATLVPGRYRVFVWLHGCREGSVEFDVPAGGTIEIPVERAR